MQLGHIIFVVTPLVGFSRSLAAPPIAVISACILGRSSTTVSPLDRARVFCAVLRSLAPPATNVGPSRVSKRVTVRRFFKVPGAASAISLANDWDALGPFGTLDSYKKVFMSSMASSTRPAIS